MTLMSFFKLNPRRVSIAKESPSFKGIPKELENSIGAAPVPPSPPSIVMKSGLIPSETIALHKSINSSFLPIQILNPMGFPPDKSLSF